MNNKLPFSVQIATSIILNMNYKLIFILYCVYLSAAKPTKHFLHEDIEQAKDIASMLLSNHFVLKESDLPETAVVAQGSNDDTTMLISKLTDTDLISLLQKTQKQDSFDGTDIKTIGKNNKGKKRNIRKETFLHVPYQGTDRGSAFFRIDNKEVEPYNVKVGADPNYLAHQKIQNLLHIGPVPNIVDFSREETEEKNKELLFDILTAQLKKLCCKSSKSKKTKERNVKLPSYEPLLNISNSHNNNQSTNPLQYEQMFLIINDEIPNDQGSDIIYVDPDSLSENSSVVLLGPITTPLNDPQLNIVMNRITTELSKPEYIPLMQDLSEGTVNKDNTRLIKSLISGSNTRRYIKPHRCNQRYPLSQGPKWLVCTGYLNLNTPSLYD
ncbi:uncharacterized protein LOC134804218 [Cydia splendana]|uniref:uncharacterized protein LOC134804218 n=1 Tax=Cydia splendana TaxID=1100963 RepID=UPI0028F4BBF4